MATIRGRNNANDRLSGTKGDDTIDGLGGDDWISGSAGRDTITGGIGNDTVDYSASERGTFYSIVTPFFTLTFPFDGVVLNLSTGEGFNGDALGDTYRGIENVIGSSFNDWIIGDNHANTILGGDGDDAITGLDGGDTLDGGGGHDALDYSSSTAGVTINLETRAASGGHADGDVISGFEVVVGSAHDDNLSGDNGDNYLGGGDGNDELYGQGGNDQIVGDAGKDHLDGGDGDDTLWGEEGGDNLDGGDGNDTLWGGEGRDHIQGGDGADRLVGGSQSDTLVGGAGPDTFVFSTYDWQPGTDTIVDFEAGDIVELEGINSAGYIASYDAFTQTVSIQYVTASGPMGTILIEGIVTVDDFNAVNSGVVFV